METALSELRLPTAVDDGATIPADQLYERALSVAGGLRARGVERGQVVAFPAPPTASTLVAYAACWSIGAVSAPLHHRLTAAETNRLLKRLAPAAVLGPDIRGTPIDPAPLVGSALAVLLATSGSSGPPKLVRHLHDRLQYKADLMAQVHGLTADDVVLMPAPMAHISGLLNGLLLPGAVGMRVVFLRRWDPAAALDLIERAQVSFMIGPPTYFVQLWSAPGFTPGRVRSLRLLSCGGAEVTEAFCRTAADRLAARVKRTYGSTEAPTVTTSGPDDPEELGWSTDGHPVGAVELRLDDTTGELLVRGPELFDGYTDAAQTARVLSADGWFRTGDRARIDDGWLTITGRLTDTIIRGGENIDPTEVAATCALLGGVQQAVAVGYPDDVMGERVGVALIADPPPSLDELRKHCLSHGLAKFKLPERMIVLAELPTLTVGKPDRAALRELLSAAGSG